MSAKLTEQSRRGTLLDRLWGRNPEALGSRGASRGFVYRAYVPKAIAAEDFTLSSSIAAAAANAERACHDLNEDPPTLANLEVLTRQLLRAESVASSRIEGLVLSHRRLAKAAFSHDVHDVTAQSVLANIEVLRRAVDLAANHELEPEHLLEIHRTLFEGSGDTHAGGVLRKDQNWVGGAASTPRDAEFIPPPPELVPGLLEDLCAFCDREDLPAVIQAAIAHAQFETIHPFHDGNGRVGRALILTILRRRRTAERHLPPVSLALAGDADRYIKGLTSWRNGDEEDWLRVFVDAVYRAATQGGEFARRVARLRDIWIDQANRPRRGSGPLRLIDLLPSHPIVNVKTASQLMGGTPERARLAISRLAEAGVLRQVTVGRRNRAWECVGLFDLLDTFERELGQAARTPHATS